MRSLQLLALLYCSVYIYGDDSTSPKTVYDTIVVGLGAAGTSALSTLSRAGKSVLGIEAASYVGGRVKTVEFGKGVIELGAEWIHGEKPSKVFDLAKENNVPIKIQETNPEVYRSDGVKLDTELMTELIEFCINIIDNPPDVPESVGQYSTRKLKEYLSNRTELLNDEDFMTGFLDLANSIINGYEATNDWNDISTASKFKSLEGSHYWSWHKYGYRTLFEILLNKYNNGTGLPAEILLNKEVVNINWNPDSASSADVVVTCKDGTTYTSRNVIVTVSLGVLKHRHTKLFTPSLPEYKVKAINDISMGVLGKLVFCFDREWWPNNYTVCSFLWKKEDRDKLPKDDEWIRKISGYTRSTASENCIVFWTSGDNAKYIETLPEDVVKSKVMEMTRKFLGKSYDIPEPTGFIRSGWYNNEFTRGSYSYDNLNTPNRPRVRDELATPLTVGDKPRLLFAGEATNEYHFSMVHGAVESGIREAERLLKAEN